MRYPLVGVAIVFGIGIVVAGSVGHRAPPWVWPACAAAALILFNLLRGRPAARRTALLAAVCCLGILRVACITPPPDGLRLRAPLLRQVEGTVVSYPSLGATSVGFILEPDELPWRLRITWFHDEAPIGAVHVGDRVRLSGSARIPEPFDGFDYPAYLARQGIFATMAVDEDGLEVIGARGFFVRRWGDRLRQTVVAKLDRWLAPAESAMARSLLFGDRTALPEPIEAAFSRTGLMHLLAVSGLHLGIFLAGAWWVLRWCGLRPRWAYPIVGLLVLAALWIVGPRLSLVRASLLFAFLALGSVLADFGWILRRTIRSMNGLAAAGIAVLAMRPGALYDAGFQLTFAATAAILVAFSPPCDWHLRLERVAGRCGLLHRPIQYGLTLVAVAAAAQAGAAPVIAWHFGALHPFGFITNLLAVPLAGVSLWCGLGAMLVSGTPLLPYATVPFSHLLSGLKAVVLLLAGIPGIQLDVARWMGVWLGALVGFAFSAAVYVDGGSSWTWKSMSIASEGAGPARGERLRRRKDHPTSANPTASLSRPGSSSKSPPRKRSPRD